MTEGQKHQLVIARKTLAMPRAIIDVLGGMTEDQARGIVNRHAKAAKDARNKARRERHQAYVDLGMKRVRGGLGGVYYE